LDLPFRPSVSGDCLCVETQNKQVAQFSFYSRMYNIAKHAGQGHGCSNYLLFLSAIFRLCDIKINTNFGNFS
jgi:hypothetical protein